MEMDKEDALTSSDDQLAGGGASAILAACQVEGELVA